MDGETVRPEPRLFEKAIFDALDFTSDQVKKAEVKIGPRTQTVIFQFNLTPDQVDQLNEMASR
jgi:hypothetical protein